MELRQLQYAIQIAKEKSFSRAADKLHIAQPSLSQQLSKLESEIGLMLFLRNTNRVELTQAGLSFVEKAQAIIDAVAQLKSEMADISHMRKGKLNIGSLPITGSHLLPLVLPIFQKKYPGIEIALVEDTSANLEALAASGQTDLSLLSLPLHEPSLDYDILIEEKICLAVPPNHELVSLAEQSSYAPIKLEQLEQQPFIFLKQGQGFRQIAVELCEQAGFTPRIVFESGNIETVQSLVAAGMGLAFVPQMVTRARWSDVAPVYLALAEPTPTRALVIAYRKGRYLSKAAEAFIETFIAVMNKEAVNKA